MGAGVSDWRLARAVASAGQMGVVSGTALDTILIRRLQDGDSDGAMRRALNAFPYQEMSERILSEWYIEGGKDPDTTYRLKPLPEVGLNRLDEELLIVANFAEVYLAKEGHSGWVGINLLEKIQLPTLPSLFGAMLAGVDAVIMGGGIPLTIPGVLDEMAELRPVELKLHVLGAERSHDHKIEFHPGTHVSASQEPLKRPCFFPVVSSETLAKTFVRKASGHVDGLIVEHYSAGGHNAPPRRDGAYSERDVCSVEKIAALGLPFWLAGSCASPERLKEAKTLGAKGVQVGSAFACSEECEGRRCLCNGLLATIGMGQVRRGREVLPLVTLGDDLSFLDGVERGESAVPTAKDVIDYLLSEPVSGPSPSRSIAGS